ncbi:MAG: TorF family putative porin [Gammaproteobacteria bacterium]
MFIWVTAAVCAPAQAEWHGELSVLSDYFYRGYSKSRSNPIVQAHVDYEDEAGWYGGLWVSMVSFDDRSYPQHADVELKPYLGLALPLTADWKTEVSVMAYVFDNKLFTHDADYVEFYAAFHFQDWFSGLVSVAPDAYQRHATVLNYELNYRRDLFETLQFSAGLGFHQAKALLERDYFYWNAGVSWFLTPHISLDFRYVDVNLDRKYYTVSEPEEFYPRLLENKYLLSVTFAF